MLSSWMWEGMEILSFEMLDGTSSGSVSCWFLVPYGLPGSLVPWFFLVFGSNLFSFCSVEDSKSGSGERCLLLKLRNPVLHHPQLLLTFLPAGANHQESFAIGGHVEALPPDHTQRAHVTRDGI